ncbi:MAG: acyltransferase domain-containing protein, partial [Bacteroidetes bacterium]|nr:acyltransferase domain-containing protein [Bacteroidota bacterium]
SLPEGEGGMAAVLAEEAIVSEYLKDLNTVDIAAVNSPKSLTISGNKAAVDEVVAQLKENKIKAINLTVSHAFHSYLMDPILKEFESVAASVQLHEPQIPVISNVTGKELQLSDIDPQYFSKHIRGTVRYWDDIQYLDQELGIDIFLEAGPNPTLIGLAKQGLTKESTLLLSSAKKGQDDWKMLWAGLQELYLADIAIDWKSVYRATNAHRIELPTYAWQRKEYWYNPVKLLIDHQQKPTPVEDKIAMHTAMKVNKDNLMDIMQREAVKILGLEKGSQLDIYKSIREQGFDSMMSGEFLAKMEKYLGAKLEMSLIHVYSDLNSLYNYIVKDIIGDNENTVSMGDVMFDAGSTNGFDAEEEEEGDWHDIKPTDGALMKLFKKFDKALGVNDK